MQLSVAIRRLVYRSGYRTLRFVWFFWRPQKRGVKCLLTDGDRVLLVRHTYGRRSWDLPGGSIKRNEPPLETAIREMGEELGLGAVDWSKIGEIQGTVDSRRDTIYCFQAELPAPTLTLDRGELAAVGWFERDELPEDLAPYVIPVLARAPAREA